MMSPAAEPESLGQFERDVLLATGRPIHVRPSRSDDVSALRAFYAALSDRSSYLRFFGSRPTLADERLHPPDGHDPSQRVTLLALDGDVVAGVGEYWRIPNQHAAEVAFAVADSHQHRGIATILLEDLAVIARSAGLERLVAETLEGNEAMRVVFRTVGLVERAWSDGNELHVELDLTGSTLLEDQADSRDWTAAAESVRHVLSPSHVAVIGAGRDPNGPGRVILANLQATFRGRISVVHPTNKEVAGIAAVASVTELDPAPELAIVAVPAGHVAGVVEECGRAGVAAIVVISAGFAEAGADGIEREVRLLSVARHFGMRVVGPNCLGVVSTANGLNATFIRRTMMPGPVAIASQSGGLGIAIAGVAAERQLGVSSFVSLGNKVDISGNDLLRYWAGDPQTSVVVMYLESLGDPRRFARIARAVSRRLPIVALKGGRTEAGRRGAASHTAALATDDLAMDALFAHTGVIRATTLDQLLDVAAVLARQPAPRGRRVALVGNAGGPLILAADAADTNRLDVVALSDELQRRIRSIVPHAAATGNPVDLLATASLDAQRAVLDEIAASGEVDACVLVNVDLDGDREAVSDPAPWTNEGVPAVAVALGGRNPLAVALPSFPTPERAVDAVALAAGYGEWLATTPVETVDAGDLDLVAIRRGVRSLVDGGDAAAAAVRPRWAAPDRTFELLGELGVPLAAWAVGHSAAECVEHARSIGFPCVLKADVTGVVHKTEAEAIAIGIRTITAVRRTFAGFRERFGDRLRAVVVQQQARPGVELLVGGVRDPAIGPLVVIAAGGVEAELLGDRSVLLAPVTGSAAEAALRGLRTFPLLRGFRGRPQIDVEPIVDVLFRVGLLMAAVPEVAELDLNPLIAAPDGCLAVDARLAVASAPVLPLRAMRVPRRERDVDQWP